MKSIVVDAYGGPESLKLKETPVPKPSQGELLLRFYAAGVNPVDTYLRSGSQGYAPKLPWTPGIDGAGIVEAVGEDIAGFSPGDKVFTFGSVTGTYAQYGICRNSQVFPLPDGLSFAEGACLGVPYFTAARALFTRGRVARGESILVHGASGGVGQACLQLAALSGLRLFGTAGSPEGTALVEGSGTQCFDHKDPRHFNDVKDASGGGVDVIIEMLANVNLDGDLKILAPGGRVAIVGSRGSVEVSPRDLMGNEGYVVGVKVLLATEDERADYARRISEGAAAGEVRPPIAAAFSLEAAAEAHQAVMAGPHAGNIVLDIG